MAVVFDAIASAVGVFGSGTSISFTNMTVGSGTNRALVACIAFSGGGGTPTGITATWDGVSMTAITGAAGSDSGTSLYVAMFGLVNPNSGNKTLVVSWTGSKETYVDAIAFTGVDQTGSDTTFPHGTAANGTSNSASVTVTSATGNYVAGVQSLLSGLHASSVNNTEWFRSNAGGAGNASANYGTGAATVALTASLDGSNLWCAAGTDILAAGSSNPSRIIQVRQAVKRSSFW